MGHQEGCETISVRVEGGGQERFRRRKQGGLTSFKNLSPADSHILGLSKSTKNKNKKSNPPRINAAKDKKIQLSTLTSSVLVPNILCKRVLKSFWSREELSYHRNVIYADGAVGVCDTISGVTSLSETRKGYFSRQSRFRHSCCFHLTPLTPTPVLTKLRSTSAGSLLFLNSGYQLQHERTLYELSTSSGVFLS